MDPSIWTSLTAQSIAWSTDQVTEFITDESDSVLQSEDGELIVTE